MNRIYNKAMMQVKKYIKITAKIKNTIKLEQYGWFFNRDDKTFRGIRKGGPAIGYEESIKVIEEVFEKHGPFDGLLGFSQGACFVGLLCDLQQRNSKQKTHL